MSFDFHVIFPPLLFDFIVLKNGAAARFLH